LVTLTPPLSRNRERELPVYDLSKVFSEQRTQSPPRMKKRYLLGKNSFHRFDKEHF
jgi:hypothetical protein